MSLLLHPQRDDLLLAVGLIIAGCGLAYGLGTMQRAMRHVDMKRIKWVRTIAAPEKPEPEEFPSSAADIEAIIASHKPEPVSDLDRWCINNWHRLPGSIRKQCLDHLQEVLSKAVDWPETSAKWKQQKADGIRIGSDQYCFHFGTGLFIRNVLREVLKDGGLPAVQQPDGSLCRNWDDYYGGCLDELASRL